MLVHVRAVGGPGFDAGQAEGGVREGLLDVLRNALTEGNQVAHDPERHVPLGLRLHAAGMAAQVLPPADPLGEHVPVPPLGEVAVAVLHREDLAVGPVLRSLVAGQQHHLAVPAGDRPAAVHALLHELPRLLGAVDAGRFAGVARGLCHQLVGIAAVEGILRHELTRFVAEHGRCPRDGGQRVQVHVLPSRRAHLDQHGGQIAVRLGIDVLVRAAHAQLDAVPGDVVREVLEVRHGVLQQDLRTLGRQSSAAAVLGEVLGHVLAEGVQSGPDLGDGGFLVRQALAQDICLPGAVLGGPALVPRQSNAALLIVQPLGNGLVAVRGGPEAACGILAQLAGHVPQVAGGGLPTGLELGVGERVAVPGGVLAVLLERGNPRIVGGKAVQAVPVGFGGPRGQSDGRLEGPDDAIAPARRLAALPQNRREPGIAQGPARCLALPVAFLRSVVGLADEGAAVFAIADQQVPLTVHVEERHAAADALDGGLAKLLAPTGVLLVAEGDGLPVVVHAPHATHDFRPVHAHLGVDLSDEKVRGHGELESGARQAHHVGVIHVPAGAAQGLDQAARLGVLPGEERPAPVDLLHALDPDLAPLAADGPLCDSHLLTFFLCHFFRIRRGRSGQAEDADGHQGDEGSHGDAEGHPAPASLEYAADSLGEARLGGGERVDEQPPREAGSALASDGGDLHQATGVLPARVGVGGQHGVVTGRLRLPPHGPSAEPDRGVKEQEHLGQPLDEQHQVVLAPRMGGLVGDDEPQLAFGQARRQLARQQDLRADHAGQHRPVSNGRDADPHRPPHPERPGGFQRRPRQRPVALRAGTPPEETHEREANHQAQGQKGGDRHPDAPRHAVAVQPAPPGRRRRRGSPGHRRPSIARDGRHGCRPRSGHGRAPGNRRQGLQRRRLEEPVERERRSDQQCCHRLGEHQAPENVPQPR